ncbi:hypothetical protein VQ643_04325 [Pseudomonas sp. F1_0610]|uniref:hypothetical protein n=1 Tax=Pseudomonas sp. F1_0610 TaxID=3114284 RepID=UPI0039C201E0
MASQTAAQKKAAEATKAKAAAELAQTANIGNEVTDISETEVDNETTSTSETTTAATSTPEPVATTDTDSKLEPEGMQQLTLVGVRVHTKLERRCRAGLVFTREPTLIEGEALDAVDLAALETDPYLHVEYIAE